MSRKLELDLNRIDYLEHAIGPPMNPAITLPVLVDGKHSSVAVYIAGTPFDLDTSYGDKVKLVRAVAKALCLRGEEDAG